MRRPRLWENPSLRGAGRREIAFCILGMSLSQFEKLRPQLEAEGMPKLDPLTKTYCVEAVDQWWKARHNAGEPADDQPTVLGDSIAQWRKKRSA